MKVHLFKVFFNERSLVIDCLFFSGDYRNSPDEW